MRKNCLDICDTNMAYGRHTIDAWKMPEENNITKGAYPGQMPLYSEMLYWSTYDQSPSQSKTGAEAFQFPKYINRMDIQIISEILNNMHAWPFYVRYIKMKYIYS